MEIEINIPYNPSVTLKKVQEVLDYSFPECRLSMESKNDKTFLRLKKSPFVHACIFVWNDLKQGCTIIGIDGDTSKIVSFLFGISIHYIFRGSFLLDVKRALQDEFLHT